MAELKTQKNDASVSDFLASIADGEKQKDARTLLRLMQRITSEKPTMWGTAIVGFGEYHYRGASGREGDWPVTGFSPRAKNLTVYIMGGFETLKPKLAKLGKHSTGVSCLYIRRLVDVDMAVLEAIIRQGVTEAKALDQKRSESPRTKAAGKGTPPSPRQPKVGTGRRKV